MVHPNHRYVVDQALALAGPKARILDFGCGSGEVVQHGRARGLDITGADVFYAGSRAKAIAKSRGLLGRALVEIKDGRLPFSDHHFDVVVSNQVFEHVDDIDLALADIRRVLKPGGTFLNIFPSIGVLREGHCGVPFAHWLQPAPAAQRQYLYAMRLMGLGYFKRGRSCREWAAHTSDWLQKFTRYRTRRSIYRYHLRHFSRIERRESDFASYRLALSAKPVAARIARMPLLRTFAAVATSRLGTMVIVAR